MRLHAIATAALAAATALPSQALLLTDPAALGGGSLVIDFEAFDGLLTSGPVTLAPGVVFTGDSGAELGANVRDLGDNGVWGANGFFAAGGVSGELRFSFDAAPAAGAGAFVSHFASDALPFALAVEVSVYGANNQILETYGITVDASATDYNVGQWVGVARAEGDIRAISFKGVGVVADNLSVSAVPEPGTWAMLLGGVAVLGALRRRQARG